MDIMAFMNMNEIEYLKCAEDIVKRLPDEFSIKMNRGIPVFTHMKTGYNGERIMMERKIGCKDIIEITDNLFEALSNYIGAFDETWNKRIVPAKDDKIERFKQISRIAKNEYNFPKSYLLFLKHMGQDDGGLLSESFCGTANIDELISHYERYGERLFDDFEMKPNQLLFFLNEMEAEYYITNRNDGTHVITTNFDDTYEVDGFSENFEKMLFQTAFIKYERQCFDHTIYFGTNRVTLDQTMKQLKTNNILDIVDVYGKGKGFEKAWFSDKWHYIAVKDNASLYVHLGFAMSGYIIGNDYSEIEELAKELSDIIGTRIQ